MLGWLFRRVGEAMFVLIAMTVIVFLAVNVIGNPVDTLIPPDADQIERARIIASLGLDRPLPLQYLHFVADLLQGNFARSYVYNESSLMLVLQRVPASLELIFFSLLIAAVIGIPCGLYAGLRPNSLLSKVIMSGSIVGFSIPSFWFALVLIMFFAVDLKWLPSGGRGETAELLGIQWAFLTPSGLVHLAMPAATLALARTSMIVRLVRAGVREVVTQDYVRFARAKGLRERRVIGVHVLKNIMIPVVTVIGVEFGTLIGFAVVVENIFAWPGMGRLLINSIHVLDRPVLVASLMVIVTIVLITNVIVDCAYTLLDPRIALGSRTT